jgi:hypothetical protein
VRRVWREHNDIKDETEEDGRNVNLEELHNLYSSHNTIGIILLRWGEG